MSDAVQQSIGVAETLIGQYDRELRRYLQAVARHATDEASVTRAEVERVYAAIWEQLAVAATHTRAAGRSTEAFEQLRAGTDTRGSKDLGTPRQELHRNERGIALAREASQSLRAAWPELVFVADTSPDVDVRAGGVARVVRGIARLFGKRL